MVVSYKPMACPISFYNIIQNKLMDKTQNQKFWIPKNDSDVNTQKLKTNFYIDFNNDRKMILTDQEH